MTPVREPGLRNTVPMSPESVGEVALAAKALTSESGPRTLTRNMVNVDLFRVWGLGFRV